MNWRGYPLRVISKIIFLHLTHRLLFLLPDKHFLMNYCGGKIYLNLREYPTMMERVLDIYEYWKTRLLMNIVREGMTTVDVGVNKGYFSLLFAKLMNDKGRVLSFEPNPSSCFWFMKSVEANGYKSIKLYQCALSNNEENIDFYLGKKSGWGSLFFSHASVQNKKPIRVMTRKLDNVLREGKINNVDIIKIDAEGADYLVLAGAERTLKRSKNMKLVMDIHLDDYGRIFDFLEACDFEVFEIGRELKHVRKTNKGIKEIYAVKSGRTG